MRHQILKMFAVAFLCSIIVQVLFWPTRETSESLIKSLILSEMKKHVSIIHEYEKHIGIKPYELEKITGDEMNWRVSLFKQESFHDFEDLDIRKPWNDENNYYILNQDSVVKKFTTPYSTPEESFTYILVIPEQQKNNKVNFFLLESSLDGHHWSEPRQSVKMNTEELLEMNRKDRQKIKHNKTHYCTLEFDKGVIHKDKDLKKILEKMKSDNYTVLK